MTARRIWPPVAAFLLVTVAWVAASAYRTDIEAAYARLAGSEIANTTCGPIEYVSLGSGPAVLIVHGAGGGFDQGLAIGREIAAAGFGVVSISRFGYLRTPLPADASAAAQADAHTCLLDALQIDTAAVIGASAGAPSSMQVALRHADRVRALILLVPAAYVPRADSAKSLRTPAGTEVLFDTALRSDFLFWTAIRVAPTVVTRAILATPPELLQSASVEEKARVEQIMKQILPVSPRRLGLLNDASLTSKLTRYELERIATPTLTISVADDLFGTFDSARYTAEHIRGARFVAYPSGGHVWVGHHAAVMAEIIAFLRTF